jgi:hypothetical protein
MFHLWVGVMTGVLVAYVIIRSAPPPPLPTISRWLPPLPAPQVRPWYQSPTWWVAGASILVLFTMVAIDLIRSASTALGLIDGIKSMLLPWAAGCGFGVWMYLTVAPLARQGGAGSWIPMLITFLLVAAIVSDERYGWFARLQKISFGGGGIEFTATAQSQKSSIDRSAGSLTGKAFTGEARIGLLVQFMENLPTYIRRDLAYAKEIGYFHPEAEQQAAKDLDFADRFVMPLAGILKRIHDARGYNDIGFLVDRALIADFHALARGHLNDERKQALLGKIEKVWKEACDIEDQLRRGGYIASTVSTHGPDDYRARCTSGAKEAFRPPGRPPVSLDLNPDLPYAILLAAMLLNAAGEADSAIRDLDRWAVEKRPDTDQDYRWFGVYRALFESANLATYALPSETQTFVLIEQLKKVLERGSRLLNNTFPSNAFSWRTQMDRLENADPTNEVWHTGICANDLSPLFKRFAVAYFVAMNSLAYALSENTMRTMRLGFRPAMKDYGDRISKLKISCLELGSSPELRASLTRRGRRSSTPRQP